MDNAVNQSEKFNELLNKIREQVDGLKSDIKELKKENSRLKNQLEDLQGEQTDIFSAITESERIALRHQVLGLITKIDNHLEGKHEIN